MADTIKEKLPEFFIEGEPTEEVLGKGAYATVKKIIVDETECAAKIIYSTISFSSDVANHHVKELSLHSNLRHPHIVQFLGICQLPDSSLPALVTELMDTSLHKFLVDPATKDQVPISHKKSILEDVSKGLIYLHKKGIVHRDLTANNVLLTSSLVAKIADLGNSRLLPKEKFAELISKPGTLVYMPPEAHGQDYSHKLDIFSFGHLTLFTMIQVFPDVLLSTTYQDPAVPIDSESLKPHNEVARREKYFKIMSEKLPTVVHNAFADLTKWCLAYIPDKRPGAIEILHRLRQIQVGRRNEGMNSINIDLFTRKRNEEEKQQLRNNYEATIQTQHHAIEQKDREIHDLQERLRALEAPDLAAVGLIQNGVSNLALAQPANFNPQQGDNPDPPADLAPEAEPQPRTTVDNHKLRIVAVGKPGVGKTTLINGLFEDNMQVHVTAQHTENVCNREFDIESPSGHKVTVVFTDTPGMEALVGVGKKVNRRQYVQSISGVIKMANIVLYCLRMDDAVCEQEVETMRYLLKEFGDRMWAKIIFVLTFANKVIVEIPEEHKQQVFDDQFASMQRDLQRAMQQAGISKEKAEATAVCVAGSPWSKSLPGCDNWICSFLVNCLKSGVTDNTKATLLHSTWKQRAISTRHKIAATAGGGAGVATGLGFMAIGGVMSAHPIGLPIGVPLIVAGSGISIYSATAKVAQTTRTEMKHSKDMETANKIQNLQPGDHPQ